MFRRYEDEPRERAEKFDGGWERALTKKPEQAIKACSDDGARGGT